MHRFLNTICKVTGVDGTGRNATGSNVHFFSNLNKLIYLIAGKHICLSDNMTGVHYNHSEMCNAINLSDTIIEAHRMDISAIS